MVHLHAAIAIDQHQRAGLIVQVAVNEMPNFTGVMAMPRLRCGCAALNAIDLLAPRREIAGFLQLSPDPRDALGVFHRLSVVRGLAFAIEIALADHIGRQSESARDPVQNVFDHQHALRPAEAAERGLRSLVRLADLPRDLDSRQVVGVVHMKHGAPQDGLGEVEAPAAVGEQVDARGLQPAVAVEARREARQERVPLAGERHVERRGRRTRTGRPVFHAPSAATAAKQFACISLPPNAPPMRRHSTVTRCRGTPSTRATISCVSLGCCVEECSDTPPDSSSQASVACVSR